MHPFPGPGYTFNTLGPFGAGSGLSPTPPYTSFSCLHAGQGVGLNSVSLAKADRKAWNSHQKCEDSLFVLSVCPVSVACQGKIVAWDCLEILLSFCTYPWLGKGRLSSMTDRFSLVIHPASFHLGVFLSWNPAHHTVKTKQLFLLSHKPDPSSSVQWVLQGCFHPKSNTSNCRILN